MKQKPSFPGFADRVLGQRKVKQTFFSRIDKIVGWNPIRDIIEIAYTQGHKSTARPGYDGIVLFKTELLRIWYGLSDGEVEELVNDRLSFSRFVGLGTEDSVPTVRRCAASATPWWKPAFRRPPGLCRQRL